MNWTDFVGFTFCEGEYYKDRPVEGVYEFANAATSLFMCIFSIINFYGGLKAGILINYLNALLFVNGVGSILFHSTLHFGWSLVDEVPMIIMMSIGCTVIVDLLLRRFIKQNRHELLYCVLSAFNVLIFTFYSIFTISIDATQSSPELFRILFASPYLILIIGILSLYLSRPENYNLDSPIINASYLDNLEQGETFDKDLAMDTQVYDLTWFSIVSGIIALTCWLLDNTMCTPIISLLRLHGFWHLLISYSTHCLLNLSGYLRAYNKNQQCNLVWWLKVIPVVIYQ